MFSEDFVRCKHDSPLVFWVVFFPSVVLWSPLFGFVVGLCPALSLVGVVVPLLVSLSCRLLVQLWYLCFLVRSVQEVLFLSELFLWDLHTW